MKTQVRASAVERLNRSSSMRRASASNSAAVTVTSRASMLVRGPTAVVEHALSCHDGSFVSREAEHRRGLVDERRRAATVRQISSPELPILQQQDVGVESAVLVVQLASEQTGLDRELVGNQRSHREKGWARKFHARLSSYTNRSVDLIVVGTITARANAAVAVDCACSRPTRVCRCCGNSWSSSSRKLSSSPVASRSASLPARHRPLFGSAWYRCGRSWARRRVPRLRPRVGTVLDDDDFDRAGSAGRRPIRVPPRAGVRVRPGSG